MRVLIAGSSGMVGSALVRKFNDFGFTVSTLSRENVDLTDEKGSLRFIDKIRPDLIVMAAAKVGGISANLAQPVQFLETNLRIQQSLMGAAYIVGIPKLIFLGSSCVYPRDSHQPIKEEYLMTGPLEPTNSAYAIAKIAGIELVKSYRKEFGLKWISLMPTNLYGPNDNFNLNNSHVMPALIRRFVEAIENGSDKVTLWGSGSPLREFLHVDDLAQAVLVAAKEYDSSLHLNVGSGVELSVKQLATEVSALAGFNGKIEWDTSRPDGTPRKVLDISRIKALGWEPKIKLSEGIASTIAWYKETNSWGGIRK